MGSTDVSRDLHLREDVLESAPATLAEILRDTRARDGSLGIEVLQDVTDPTHLTYVERWASLEAHDAYVTWRRTPEGAALMHGMSEMLAAPSAIHRFTTTSTF